jgi:CRISPR-associated protein Cas2
MDKPVRVFVYDIFSDKRRVRLADLLEDHAVRVQDSVFEARLDDNALTAIVREIAGITDPEDKVRIYTLTQEGLKRSLSLGGVPLPEEQNFWLV